MSHTSAKKHESKMRPSQSVEMSSRAYVITTYTSQAPRTRKDARCLVYGATRIKKLVFLLGQIDSDELFVTASIRTSCTTFVSSLL